MPRLGGYLTQAEPGAVKSIGKPKEKNEFDKAMAVQWKQVFADDCTGDWHDNWFLDGEVGKVKNGPEGMNLTTQMNARTWQALSVTRASRGINSEDA